MLHRPRNPCNIDSTNGQVFYGQNGTSTVVGGYRPAKDNTIKTFPTNNTFARIRFVQYVKNSNNTNNNDINSYTYGDIVIIGRGTGNPVKFVSADIRGYDGNPKAGFSMSDTTILWNTYGGQGISLQLNQTTGQLRLIQNDNTYAFFFEILGGI